MYNKPIAKSVKNLQQLYTVLIGLSLAAGIQQIINFSGTKFPIYFDRLPLFFVYLSLVIPIYHGAMRHLDVAYIENVGKHLALIFDFIILFIEGCFFLLLAGLVPYTYKFFYVLVTLLGIDVFWACIAYFGFATDGIDKKASSKWGLINFFAVCLLLGSYLYCDSLDSNIKPVEYYLKQFMLIIIIIRSVLDYLVCWPMYYPDLEKNTNDKR